MPEPLGPMMMTLRPCGTSNVSSFTSTVPSGAYSASLRVRGQVSQVSGVAVQQHMCFDAAPTVLNVCCASEAWCSLPLPSPQSLVTDSPPPDQPPG